MVILKRSLVVGLGAGSVFGLVGCGGVSLPLAEGTISSATASPEGDGTLTGAAFSFNVTADSFEVRATTAASTPDYNAFIIDGSNANYDPGCTDTVAASEVLAPGSNWVGPWFTPLWTPYSCAGPDADASKTIEDWNKGGHIHAFLNGTFIGEGYASTFTLPIFTKALYMLPTDLDGDGIAHVDFNGFAQPWIDFGFVNDDFYMNYNDTDETGAKDSAGDGDFVYDFGKDFDGDGVIGGPETEEADTDGDGHFDTETDLNGDGQFDLYKEDVDNDRRIDVNEDAAGNNDGVKDYKGEDLDCDGRLDVDEDLNDDGVRNCDEPDEDGDGRLDKVDEDTNGDGLLTSSKDAGGDPDLDGDCRIDMPDPDKDGVVNDSEDLDGDGALDKDEDIDNDGVLDNEDTDGDFWPDIDESALPMPWCGSEFGCEGDEIYLVRSGDFLFDGGGSVMPLFDSIPDDACTEDVDETVNYYVIKLQLVHDDHSPLYGPGAIFEIKLTQDEIDALFTP